MYSMEAVAPQADASFEVARATNLHNGPIQTLGLNIAARRLFEREVATENWLQSIPMSLPGCKVHKVALQ